MKPWRDDTDWKLFWLYIIAKKQAMDTQILFNYVRKRGDFDDDPPLHYNTDWKTAWRPRGRDPLFLASDYQTL